MACSSFQVVNLASQPKMQTHVCWDLPSHSANFAMVHTYPGTGRSRCAIRIGCQRIFATPGVVTSATVFGRGAKSRSAERGDFLSTQVALRQRRGARMEVSSTSAGGTGQAAWRKAGDDYDDKDGWAEVSSLLEGTVSMESSLLDSQVSKGPSLDTRTVNLTIHHVGENEGAAQLEGELRQLDGVEDMWVGPVREGRTGHGPEIPIQLVVNRRTSLSRLMRDVQALEDAHAVLALPFNNHSWMWRGHRVHYAVAGCGSPVILVHGFGGNCGHFRNLISELADDHRVYSVDLLGFGGSDKPADVDYNPHLWAEQITDFAAEFAEEPAVLVGNSIGSLTALGAAAKMGDTARGLVLLNCTGAMNRKGLAEDDILIRILTPVFVAVEYLLKQPRVARYLFNGFRSKSYIKKILEQQVYVNKAAVTDRLVDILTTPAFQDGALDVFVKVFTGHPGPRPETLAPDVDCPMLVLWGEKDPWTGVNGKVANYFKQLERERNNVRFERLPNVAHCPHDDAPELVASRVLPWLRSL
eukprot:TRINITY_DN19258_c0_g1_i1.p1 TRINITY_DN19258_c0_g1~~TRINITY_DN19258_c0_g1_i1.p1  ORF type:complete len:527 (+),score=73.41 TRINITY_DN19258_c0_g1_i1:169-1749(+)